MAHYGVPVPAGGLVASEAAAVETARRLGGKVAMKAVGSQIQHKTEGGLVVLGITGDEAVAETYRLLQERAGTALEAVLVEKMIAGNRELLVGLKRDPVFGPVVAFGLGGVMTEVFKDIALARVPLGRPGRHRTARLHPGHAHPRRVPGSAGGRPRRAVVHHPGGGADRAWTSPRSPRSTSTRCWSRVAHPWRPTLW